MDNTSSCSQSTEKFESNMIHNFPTALNIKQIHYHQDAQKQPQFVKNSAFVQINIQTSNNSSPTDLINTTSCNTYAPMGSYNKNIIKISPNSSTQSLNSSKLFEKQFLPTIENYSSAYWDQSTFANQAHFAIKG